MTRGSSTAPVTQARSPGHNIPVPLTQGRIVAVLRAASGEHFRSAADVLVAEGVRCIEVTLTGEGAMDALTAIVRNAPGDVAVGAGSVMSTELAEQAIGAGAQFLVSPVTQPAVMAVGREASVPTYPGALTPTEILTASEAGAPLVKLFPASTVGPGYIKDLHGPMPHAKIMPTGGIAIADIGSWLRAGAVAVGLGGPLLGDALAGGSLRDLAERARLAVAAASIG